MRSKRRSGYTWRNEDRTGAPERLRRGGSNALQRRERRRACFFLLPSLAGVLCFVLLPFADVVRRSFATAVTGKPAGFDNYRQVFRNEAFRLAVGNTLRFVGVCLPLLILLGLAAALLLSGLRLAPVLKSIFLFPMAMPAATVVAVWKLTFAKDGFLNLLTGAQIDYMETDAAFWVLVFSYLWKNLGYTVVLWLAGIGGIPEELLEAARTDGAGRIRIFVSIQLPLLKGILYTITVLSFLNSFKVFREAYLVAGAYPQESIYLLQHLFNNWFARLELDKMAAAAVCVGLALLTVILALQRLWEGKAKEWR